MRDNVPTTVAIIGASRGLGRGAVEAFAAAGATVLALARTETELLEIHQAHPSVVPIVNDATDPASSHLIAEHQPSVVVLVAGATPHMAPFDQQTWEQFSTNWETDVKLTHTWLSAALTTPLKPSARMIVVSSGAALGGSPLSGGYAGAKAMQRFLARYADEEAQRRGLGFTVTSVIPKGPTPLTQLGAAATRQYAARAGLSEAEYQGQANGFLTPAQFGSGILEISLAARDDLAEAYLLTSAGPQVLA